MSFLAPPPSIASFLADAVVPDDPFKSLGGEHVCQSKKRGCIAHALFHEARFRPIFEEAAAAKKAIAEREGFVAPLKSSSGRKPSRTKRTSGATGVTLSSSSGCSHKCLILCLKRKWFDAIAAGYKRMCAMLWEKS